MTSKCLLVSFKRKYFSLGKFNLTLTEIWQNGGMIIKLEQQLQSFTDILVRNLRRGLWAPTGMETLHKSFYSLLSKCWILSSLWPCDKSKILATDDTACKTVKSINSSDQKYLFPRSSVPNPDHCRPAPGLLCAQTFHRSHIPSLQSWLAIFVTPIWKIN